MAAKIENYRLASVGVGRLVRGSLWNWVGGVARLLFELGEFRGFESEMNGV